VRALNRMGAAGEPQIIASMYRHLAHWPASLALSQALLAPLDAAGALSRAVEATKALARAEARRLAPLLPRLPPPPHMPRVAGALEAFTGEAIARMVVNGGVLLQAIEPQNDR
jgi:histidinol-phosphate/aromatic aminotransferase/cobyric acid decarboxylase-like protein